jgi:hypothetical protein
MMQPPSPLSPLPRIACVIAALAGLAVAQTSPPDPKNDPELNNPNLTPGTHPVPVKKDEPKAIDPKPTTQPQGTVPTLPATRPGIGTEAPPITAGRFLPEGTFVTERTGSLLLTEGGDAIFIPRGESASKDLGPVVLLPCQRLEQMIAAKASHGDQIEYTIAGQVFTYREREFILPTIFAIHNPAAAAPAPAPAATPAPTSTPPSPAPANATGDLDPKVADLIRDLEQSRTGPRKVSPQPAAAPASVPTAPTPAGSDATATKALSNEGTLLTNRRGRLIRLAQEGGRLALVLDNDPNSPGGTPLILQPSRMMQQMESMASIRGDAISFRVSGRVMVFNAKNYLLPTFFQIPPKSDITPRQ